MFVHFAAHTEFAQVVEEVVTAPKSVTCPSLLLVDTLTRTITAPVDLTGSVCLLSISSHGPRDLFIGQVSQVPGQTLVNLSWPDNEARI